MVKENTSLVFLRIFKLLFQKQNVLNHFAKRSTSASTNHFQKKDGC